MTRLFTRQEVETHNHKDDIFIIIDNIVYDVTKFLEDHPGGHEVLLDNAGRDASKCFNDVGHSEEAIEMRKDYRVGEIVQAEKWEVIRKKTHFGGGTEPITLAGFISAAWPPAMMAVVAWFLYSYFFV